MANFEILPEATLQEWTNETFDIDNDKSNDAKVMKEKISYQVIEQGEYEKSSIWDNNFMALASFICLTVICLFLALLKLCFKKCEKAKRLIEKM